MRKRSKKRIPQDIKPWIRLREVDQDSFNLPGKKSSRWVAGARRDWDTRILQSARRREITGMMLRAFATDLAYGKVAKDLHMQKIVDKLHGADKTTSLAKYKNFCLVSGRARTYNRSIYLARHNLRKLVGVGLISGLIK